MQVAIFFLLTVFVCVGIGVFQIVSGITMPIWLSYALGAAIAAPTISFVSHKLSKKREERESGLAK